MEERLKDERDLRNGIGSKKVKYLNKLLTQYIHDVMKAENMKYIGKYSYKNISSETVFFYLNPVKKGTFTNQTVSKIKVFWTGRR
jgi:hypothetical protein